MLPILSLVKREYGDSQEGVVYKYSSTAERVYKNSSGTMCHLLLKRRSICYYSPHYPPKEEEFTYCEFGYSLDKLYTHTKKKDITQAAACVISFFCV